MSTKNLKLLFGVIIGFWILFIINYFRDFIGIDTVIHNELLHSTMEAIGALASFMMGILLLQKSVLEGSLRHICMINGLIVMGILDCFHSIVPPGNNFVLLHSTSVFLGGLFFSFLWFSKIHKKTAFNRIIISFTVLGSILFAIWTILFPEAAPRMMLDGKFTISAVFLNVSGGILFLIASAFFINKFYRSSENQLYWFAIFSLLLGLGGITFMYGEIWTGAWWFWHFLRLAAFLIVLLLVITNYQQTVSKLQISLEERRRADMIQTIIFKISEESRRSDGLEVILERIHNELNNVMDAKNLYVAIYNDKEGKYYFPYHQDESDDSFLHKTLSLEKTITDYVRRTGVPQLITKEIEEKLRIHNEIIVVGELSKVWMGAPILGRNDKVIGVIAIQNYIDEKTYTENELRLLAHVANNIGALIEKKKTEEEHLKLEEQLQQAQKMEAIGTLAGGIAHDFNNILGVIMGYTDLVLDDPDNRKDVITNLTRVMSASYRAKDMVNQILAFSRKDDQSMASVNIGKIIKETIAFLQPSIPTTIEIRSEVVNKGGLILGNKTQINQILMNLCNNAAHAMKDEGGVLKIELKEIVFDNDNSETVDNVPGTYLHLIISDTGTGMKKEILDRIFEPYFTTKKDGEGTGMGLAVIYGIIKSHKGVIKVNSELGKGTVFNIFFPVLETPDQFEAHPTPKPAVIGNSETVLLVDDEIILVEIESKMLKQLGYKVEGVSDSVKALEVFKADPWKFDLILSDMTMPNMTGVKLASEIHKIRPDIPILICTGFSSNINENNFKNYGISALVMKPLEKNDLAEIIRKVLNRKLK